jgi:hypothetical protein
MSDTCDSVVTVQEMIRTLEMHTAALSSEIRDDLAGQKQESELVKGSVERLASNDYSNIRVGDYHLKREGRSKAAESNRQQYEVRGMAC